MALVIVTAACGTSATGDSPDAKGDDTSGTSDVNTNPGEKPCRIDKECVYDAPCVIGVCDTATKLCREDVKPGSCYVDGQCYLTAEASPDHACKHCDPTTSPIAFTFRPGQEGYESETQKLEDGTIARVCIDPCERYCKTVAENCTDLNQQWATGDVPDAVTDEDGRIECDAYCRANWLAPTAGPEVGAELGSKARGTDAIGCRQHYAESASESATDQVLLCPRAGGTGGNLCGTWCENYCHLTAMNCPSLFATFELCLEQCAPVSTTGSPGDVVGDSIQCRTYYAGLAGVENAGANCKEAAIGSTTQCQNSADVAGDSCFNPKRIDRFPFFDQATTKGARSDYRSPCGAGDSAQQAAQGDGTPDHVWELTAEANVTYTITVSPTFPAHVAVLQNTCGALECAMSSVTATTNTPGTLSYAAAKAGTLFILVDGQAPTGGAPAATVSGLYSIEVERGPTCADYCKKVTTVCSGEAQRQFGLTPSEDPEAAFKECLAFCAGDAKLASGSTSDSFGNTIGCRLYHALQAEALLPSLDNCATSETDQAAKLETLIGYCRAAGRTGGGVCGTPCDNFCHLTQTRCTGDNAAFESVSQCTKTCNNFTDGGALDTSGNSKWCRLNRLAFAAVTPAGLPPGDPAPNAAEVQAACAAAKEKSTICAGDCVLDCGGRECGVGSCGKSCGTCLDGMRCTLDGKCVPECERYCREATCTCGVGSGEDRFASRDACIEFCKTNTAAIPSTTGVAEQMQCVLWQAGNAKNADAELSTYGCALGGPQGWPACTTWCSSYCAIAAENCSTLYASSEACLNECQNFPLDESAVNLDYPTKSADTLQCRLGYLKSAKVTPAFSCPAGGTTGTASDGSKVCTGP
jgi:hypothetical protein